MNLFDILNIPLGYILRFCYSLVNNYVIALLLFSVILQILLLPFAVKQQKNSVRQASLQPKLAALKKKYAGRNDAATQQKMQEETMELYRREHFSPFSSLGPMLIQMPILFALYYVIMNPLRYITGLTADQITLFADHMKEIGIELSARGQYIEMLNHIRADVGYYASLVDANGNLIAGDLADRTLPDMILGPLDLSKTPSFSVDPFDWLILVPVLTFVFALLMQMITRRFTYQAPEAKEAQKSISMKILTYSMPLLSVWIAFSVPAGIGIYWIFRNIITTIQQVVLAKVFPLPTFTEEDYKNAEKEMKSGRPVREKSKIPPKSLHYIDDEEYQERYRAAVIAAGGDPDAEETEKKNASGRKDEQKKDVPALKEDAPHDRGARNEEDGKERHDSRKDASDGEEKEKQKD